MSFSYFVVRFIVFTQKIYLLCDLLHLVWAAMTVAHRNDFYNLSFHLAGQDSSSEVPSGQDVYWSQSFLSLKLPIFHFFYSSEPYHTEYLYS